MYIYICIYNTQIKNKVMRQGVLQRPQLLIVIIYRFIPGLIFGIDKNRNHQPVTSKRNVCLIQFLWLQTSAFGPGMAWCWVQHTFWVNEENSWLPLASEIHGPHWWLRGLPGSRRKPRRKNQVITLCELESHHVYWLVVYLPLWKMMEFVSWDDDIPNIWKVIKLMFQSAQTTNQK
jgi:hypothetical protein